MNNLFHRCASPRGSASAFKIASVRTQIVTRRLSRSQSPDFEPRTLVCSSSLRGYLRIPHTLVHTHILRGNIQCRGPVCFMIGLSIVPNIALVSQYLRSCTVCPSCLQIARPLPVFTMVFFYVFCSCLPALTTFNYSNRAVLVSQRR